MATSIKAMIATSVLAMVTGGFGPHSLAAGPRSDTGSSPTVVVQFGDLNTSTPEGIRALYSRLSAASVQVCGSQSTWYPTAYWSQKECSRTTLENLVARLNLPQLTALHRESTHGRLPAAAVRTVKH